LATALMNSKQNPPLIFQTYEHNPISYTKVSYTWQSGLDAPKTSPHGGVRCGGSGIPRAA
jgi:hypothetical protein